MHIFSHREGHLGTAIYIHVHMYFRGTAIYIGGGGASPGMVRRGGHTLDVVHTLSLFLLLLMTGTHSRSFDDGKDIHLSLSREREREIEERERERETARGGGACNRGLGY